MEILLDKGTGVGDGFSVNICYINKENVSVKPTMYSIEVAPRKVDNSSDSEPKSQVSARCIPHGEIYVHCNKWELIFVAIHVNFNRLT